MDVVDIVKQYLEENGYDGLYSEAECACLKDNLAPCDNMAMSCRAGYLQPDPEPEYEFVIGETKHEVAK